MFKIDTNLIKDRLAGVSFQFLTDEEIQKLSVVEVRNPQTFDHLDNANAEGLHDKRMGVSPFDSGAMCPTCGLTSNYCPGHHGHIQLVAPIYNPFMIKEMHRIMKSKCFHCHRLRISDSKIGVFVTTLKLVKAGEVIQSQRVKHYFFSLARDYALQVGASGYKDKEVDPNVVKRVVQEINRMFSQQEEIYKGSQATEQDVQEAFTNYNRKFNIERERLENSIIELLEDVEENSNSEHSNRIGLSSTIQKFQIDTIKEIWSHVITTKCPHCKKNSPAFRKDGYTKMFVKPLAGRSKAVAEQRKRVQGEASET